MRASITTLPMPRCRPCPIRSPFQKSASLRRLRTVLSGVGRLAFPSSLRCGGMDVNDLEVNLKDYHKAWRESGHPGESGDISVRLPMYVAPTDDEAVEDPKETIEAYFMRMRRIFEEGWGSP